jgi:DinB superfamily
MASRRDDLLSLFDYVWQRLRTRMSGLTDDEWRWEPITDDRVTLRWRLAHITALLTEDRTGPWLGLPLSRFAAPEPGSAVEVLTTLDEAYAAWRAKLAETTEESLAEPIGQVAGQYGTDSRYAFGLHIVDELIHHGAEAALLRDLYAGRPGPAVRSQ